MVLVHCLCAIIFAHGLWRFKIHSNSSFFSASPPSAPLSLTSSTTFSSVTISWVAPLDTPLCVHSYTVNISNSSQVMVYNTTDTSLNITDLTPGNEYSVTVAGRDGAGRLGQESNMQLPMPEAIGKLIKLIINFYNQIHSIIIIFL